MLNVEQNSNYQNLFLTSELTILLMSKVHVKFTYKHLACMVVTIL